MSQGRVMMSLPLPAASTPVTTAAQAVVFMMLGICRHQAAVEAYARAAADRRERLSSESSEDSTDSESAMPEPAALTDNTTGPHHQLLANRCLALFLAQSGVAIVEKKMNFHLQRLTVTFDAAARNLRSARTGAAFTDKMAVPFWYSPAYTLLSGQDAATGRFSAETLASQQQRLSLRIMARFWEAVAAQNYLPSPELRASVTPRLQAYLTSALGRTGEQTARFAPTADPFMLYLFGTAGTGKSAFVKALRKAMEVVLVEFFNPDTAVDTVKVPLNAMTPENLRKELSVKGISDWSVERMVEQSLARGRLVLLHLEENPEEEPLQEELFALIQEMVATLLRRYPGRRSDLVFVFTSNYEPSPSIAAKAVRFHVRAPDAAAQHKLCSLMLADTLVQQLRRSDAERATERAAVVDMLRTATPPSEADSEDGEESDESGSDMDCASESGESVCSTWGGLDVQLAAPPPLSQDMRPLDKWIASVAFALRQHLLRAGVGRALLAEAPLTVDVCRPEHSVEDGRRLANMWVHFRPADAAADAEVPSVLLASFDDYHFWPKPELYSAQAGQAAAAAAVVGMLAARCLKPAVLVVRTDEQQALVERLLADHVGARRMAEARVDILREEDKEVVLGSPWDFPRGGLFKVIDECNNPAARHAAEAAGRAAEFKDFVAIHARVNAVGQYILRELLENNASRTHRQTVHKDGVAFVLRLDHVDGEVTETLQSRAQFVFF